MGKSSPMGTALEGGESGECDAVGGGVGVGGARRVEEVSVLRCAETFI